MGRLFKEYLSDERVFICAQCNTHLISKNDVSFVPGMDLYICKKSPINSHYVQSHTSLVYNERKYTFYDIKCNDCSLVFGWKLKIPSSNNDNTVEMTYVIDDKITLIHSP